MTATKRTPKPKLSPRERGYVTAREAARGLRGMADSIEHGDPGQLVKYAVNVWFTPNPDAMRREEPTR